MKDLEDRAVGQELRQVRRRACARRDLDHVGGAVTGRQLHHAEAIAMRLAPPGLGVDRPRAALVAEEIGQGADVAADGHCGPWGGEMTVVPSRGLDPPRLAALVPETSASTNSATWALRR